MFQRSAADLDSTTSVCLACQLQIHACMHALLLTNGEHACAGHGRSHRQTYVSGRICMPWPSRLVVLSSFAACIALLPILSAGQRQYHSASGQPAVWTWRASDKSCHSVGKSLHLMAASTVQGESGDPPIGKSPSFYRTLTHRSSWILEKACSCKHPSHRVPNRKAAPPIALTNLASESMCVLRRTD